MPAADSETARAPRVIGPVGGFAIVAGSMLGIGIFLSPPIVAGHVASPAIFLAVWAAGGLTALAGAVACGELGAMLPRAGGDYVFQYEALGPSVAFASGWALFAAIFCGSVAAMSVAICSYQLPALIGVDLSGALVNLPWGPKLKVRPAFDGVAGLGRGTIPDDQIRVISDVVPVTSAE